MSKELRDYLVQKRVATSKTMPYHPTGNAQVERFNGTIWKIIQLSVRSQNLTEKYCELVDNCHVLLQIPPCMNISFHSPAIHHMVFLSHLD